MENPSIQLRAATFKIYQCNKIKILSSRQLINYQRRGRKKVKKKYLNQNNDIKLVSVEESVKFKKIQSMN